MVGGRLAPNFDDYSRKYDHLRMIRRNGILELSVHTGGDSLKWNARVHEEMGYCFTEIGADPDNKVLILTGTGESFCAEPDVASFGELTPRGALHIVQEGRRLHESLLNIEIPVIGAVQGRAWVHAELPLLSNIVIASEDASFRDAAHFTLGVVPGDGVHVLWPALLGPTRGSYFLLTGETLDAQQAKALGVVNEVVARADLLTRAWAVAEELASRPPIARRYARLLLVQEMKRRFNEQLGLGLALEGIGLLDREGPD
jgi:enoyl-CoA hydratase/carnithine racemase